MTAQNEFSNTLRFSCPACRAELAVPASMAGIEGPCPSCYQPIQAPGLEALPWADTWLPPQTGVPDNSELMLAEREMAPAVAPATVAPVAVAPLFPPVREQALRPIPPLVTSRNEIHAGGVPVPALDRGFKARLAIPAAEEPLDDTWKDRHRDQQRSSRRARRAERVAENFLNSRSFRLARVGLILASGAMLAFLFHYMRSHQWHLPGLGPSVVEKKTDPAVQPGKTRSAGGDANELMADDDAEIPPASSTIPAPPRSGTATQPFSGPPR